jgi:hypothetical protein
MAPTPDDMMTAVTESLAVRTPGRATHKLSVRSIQDVDDEVLGLLRLAYEQNA